MDLAAVFGLSLLGGYWFSSYWRLTAFSTKRAEGHHLYFRAALVGAALFLFALLLRTVLIDDWPRYARIDSALVNYVRPVLREETGAGPSEAARRDEWVITAAYSLALAPLCAALLNLVTSRRWALRRSVGGLDKLLLEAQELELPLSITLSAGKIYVGMAVDAPNPDRDADVITILPLFSGYRDDRGRMQLTTDYEGVYSALQEGRAAELRLPGDWLTQFRLAIRVDSIISAALFSPVVYTEFNAGWRERLAELKREDGAAAAPADESRGTLDRVLAWIFRR
jgi:hypothetical protein